MKKIIVGIMAMTMATNVQAQEVQNKMAEKENLLLEEAWDKVFPKSDKVEHEKVTFVNRFGITLVLKPRFPQCPNTCLFPK